ncbi:hypothetical protein LNJ08_12625 [Tenacibaculum finnmarkense genomovar ulcerans]|uniref:hypothetical protein n=1 Tax=Tenacibaculum finnmarkense TaxID=2781243 RepID=UPI001E41F4B5|nr:hypothetical protein [Tenacibaculum finnmarkense]MCD8455236.1 hypothetical protein [Tenacibaculum finnmarkense genomovar ulcerans]
MFNSNFSPIFEVRAEFEVKSFLVATSFIQVTLPYMPKKMEIGQKCKINNDDRIYKITDSKKEKRLIKETKNELKYEIEHFVNLEEIDNSDNLKLNISTTKIYPI